jgi:hypothetical protein
MLGISLAATMMHTIRSGSVKRTCSSISAFAQSQLCTVLARGIASTPARLGRGPRVPPLTTLHPQHLQPSDFRSLSGQSIAYAYTPTFSTRFQVKYHAKNHESTPFPEAAKGFWYFHPGPSHAPIAGGLRFRIVNSGNPADFDVGHDLLDFHGRLPWSIPLPSLFCRQAYVALASLLMSTPTPVYLSIIEQIENDQMPKTNSDGVVIHSLGQRLYADLSSTSLVYRIASGDKLDPSTSSIALFTDWRRKERAYNPYNGRSN